MNEIKNYLADVTVLFIDDEDGVREAFEELLGMWCKKAYSASNGKEGLAAYKKYKPDIIVTDIKMPIMSGLEMIGEIKNINPDFPIIITTAFSEPEFLLEAIELHVDGYIVKPIPKKELKKRLEIIAKSLLIEKELERIHNLNHIYLETANVLMIALDTEGNITMLNKTGCELLGLNKDETVGQNIFKIGAIPEDKIDDIKTYFFEMISGAITPSNEKYDNEWISKDKQHIMFTWSNTLIKDNNKIIGILSSGLDITDKHRLEKELIEQTRTDSLTQLQNRKSYNEKLEESLSFYKRYKKPFSILMYDIDDFKGVNDTYGHDIGDKVLIEMSAFVKANIRENDYLFRIGGEEFIIIFSDTTLEQAKIIAQKIRKKVEETLLTPQKLKLTISLGLTEVLKGDEKNIIFKRVDTLLYKSKKSGKNRISC